MSRFIKSSLCFLSFALAFSACKKNDFDAYYARPEGLAPPIYQQLQAKGNFTNLLKIIDKSGYKDILGKAGSWTLFAPDDAAFQKYFTATGLAGVDAIDSAGAKKIALYSLIYNPARKDQLTSAQTSLGSVANTAFRRQTAYYDFVYKENGKNVVDNGQNGSTYTATINNNKFIPYYISSFLDANLLNGSPSDYSVLFPSATFSGFNVVDAQVVTADIPAENGTIHEIDKVITPLPSIDQYIASQANYSEFKKLLDKFAAYTINDPLTLRYRTLKGAGQDQVYLKSYSGLAFSPNNENYGTAIAGQAGSNSIIVPTNQQLKAYTDDILEFYPNKSFETAQAGTPLFGILTTLVNSHMWTTALWPSRLTSDPNFLKEYATLDLTNMVEKKVLSNGILYGTNKVQEANVFRTVYRHSYLNPAYSMMTRAIDGVGDLKIAVTTPANKYSIFLLSDAIMGTEGYFFNPDINAWGYSANYPSVAYAYDATSLARLNRQIAVNIVKTPFGELDDLSGEGVAEGYGGEYIKFKANTVQASGNVENNTVVTVTASRPSVNGKAFVVDKALRFASDAVTLGSSLEALANSSNATIKSSFEYFYKYLLNSSASYNSSSKIITGADAGTFNTVFVPTNAAISQAVKEGRLPGNTITGIPNFVPATWTPSQATAVANFIAYSVINKFTIAVDGKKADLYPTLLKNSTGDSRKITIRYTSSAPNPAVSTFQLVDDQGTVATANFSQSNNLSNRALIHSINTVLKF